MIRPIRAFLVLISMTIMAAAVSLRMRGGLGMVLMGRIITPVIGWTHMHRMGTWSRRNKAALVASSKQEHFVLGHYYYEMPLKSTRCYASLSSSSDNITTVQELPPSDDESIYQELQWLSQEIRRHDDLYYSARLPELDDDEFDALVQREEKLSKEYPHLLKRWQTESGLGLAATRQGRVGSTTLIGEATRDESTKKSTSSTKSQEPRIKRKHLAPMLSLDNVNNDEQLWAWLKRIPKVLDEWDNHEQPTRVTILTEPKLDGVSLSLRYSRQNKNDKVYALQWASTRGDGQQGQDVTLAIQSMGQTIPLEFPAQQLLQEQLPETIEIRGEVVLLNSDFEKLSEFTPNVTFSNARNAASGILLRKETDEEADKLESEQLRSKLQFYAYDMVTDPRTRLVLDGKTIQSILADIGFSIPAPVSATELDMLYNDTLDDWSNTTIEPMLAYYKALQAHRDEKKATKGYAWGDFEMDGCVHKISQSTIRQLLGRTTKSPKWAVAHKFPPRAVVTKLLNVTVQIGRTGALTPVAVLEPVDVGGVTIQRATLHNFGHLQQVMGGTETAVGTSVLVRRAGDVIPQVVRRVGNVLETEDATIDVPMISLEPPKQCPACSSPVILEEVASAGVGQVARCGGPPLLCPPRAVTSLAHAFSRDAMDVTGLSEARIQQLMDAGLMRFPSDLFLLGDDEWNQIQELPGWGPKSAQNLRTASQRVASKGISLGRFIYSLGARHLGKHSSELVASCYVTKDAFLNALDAASTWEEPNTDQASEESADGHPFSALQGQMGIGPVLIQSLVTFSKSTELINAAKQLGNAVKVLEEQVVTETPSSSGVDGGKPQNLPWKGLRVVFTGSIPNFSRTEAHKAAKALGAKATPGSVSKSTDVVVFGDKGGKKLDQANALGIQTMTSDQFVALLEQMKINKD